MPFFFLVITFIFTSFSFLCYLLWPSSFLEVEATEASTNPASSDFFGVIETLDSGEYCFLHYFLVVSASSTELFRELEGALCSFFFVKAVVDM